MGTRATILFMQDTPSTPHPIVVNHLDRKTTIDFHLPKCYYYVRRVPGFELRRWVVEMPPPSFKYLALSAFVWRGFSVGEYLQPMPPEFAISPVQTGLDSLVKGIVWLVVAKAVIDIVRHQIRQA